LLRSARLSDESNRCSQSASEETAWDCSSPRYCNELTAPAALSWTDFDWSCALRLAPDETSRANSFRHSCRRGCRQPRTTNSKRPKPYPATLRYRYSHGRLAYTSWGARFRDKLICTDESGRAIRMSEDLEAVGIRILEAPDPQKLHRTSRVCDWLTFCRPGR
jgi:hypothetical protein